MSPRSAGGGCAGAPSPGAGGRAAPGASGAEPASGVGGTCWPGRGHVTRSVATRQFLADAAHELRTPIAGIQAGAAMMASAASQLDDDLGASQQRRRAELVLGEARQAGRLVGDMLDLSRIDAGLPLALRDCDLVTLAETECDRTALMAPSLRVTRGGVPSLTISADPDRIAQILANLTDNARRHTPGGGAILIDVRPSHDGAELTVTDTGPGVPDDQRLRIFERLARLDDARARESLPVSPR